MKTYYMTDGLFKSAEEDIFETGCQTEGGFNDEIDMTFKADTAAGVVEEIRKFLCASPDSVLLDSCDEPGRVDIQIMENAEGYQPSDLEMEKWKAGKDRLWLATYSARVVKITEEIEALT